MASWRELTAPRIARVLLDNPGLSEKEIRLLIRAAWPPAWGPRKHHPYKIWCSEVGAQLALYRKGRWEVLAQIAGPPGLFTPRFHPHYVPDAASPQPAPAPADDPDFPALWLEVERLTRLIPFCMASTRSAHRAAATHLVGLGHIPEEFREAWERFVSSKTALMSAYTGD